METGVILDSIPRPDRKSCRRHATQYRVARQAVEQATAFGIDDRDDATRSPGNDVDEGEQRGFEVFGGGVRENKGLDSF